MRIFLLSLAFILTVLGSFAQTTEVPKEEWTFDHNRSGNMVSRSVFVIDIVKGKNRLYGLSRTYLSGLQSEQSKQSFFRFSDKGSEGEATLYYCFQPGALGQRPSCSGTISISLLPTNNDGVLAIRTDSLLKYNSKNELQWKIAFQVKDNKIVSGDNGLYYAVGPDNVYKIQETNAQPTLTKLAILSSSVGDLALTTDGGFVTTGTLGLKRYNSSGTVGASNTSLIGTSLIPTTDGSFYVISSGAVVKVNADLVQSGKYETTGIKSTSLAPDQTLAILTATELVKLKSNGTVDWKKTDAYSSIAVTTDGGIAVTKQNSILKYSPIGELKWTKNVQTGSELQVFSANDGGLFYRRSYMGALVMDSDLTKLAADGPSCTLKAAIVASNTGICSGDTVKLSVTLTNASGTSAYQWYRNGVPAATTQEFKATLAGKYSVTVTNGLCKANSDTTTLIVNPLPVAGAITGNEKAVCIGNTVTLTSAVTGGKPAYSYQWFKDNASTAASTTTSFAVKEKGIYKVIATDANGCKSVPVQTTVDFLALPVAAPITGNDGAICQGRALTLKTTASGGKSGYSYQWYKETAKVGTNQDSYLTSESGEYSVTVTDANTCESLPVKTKVVVNPLPVLNPIAGATQVCQGDKATFTASVSSGASPVSYQWYKGTALLPSATSATYATGEAGTYAVSVTDANKCSVATLREITLVLNALPTAAAITGNKAEICKGTTITLASAGAGGTPAYTYEWTKDNAAIPNATAATLPVSEAGSYAVRAIDANKCKSPEVTEVVKIIDPKVFITPSKDGYCSNTKDSIRLSIYTAPNFNAETYIWKKNGVEISRNNTQVFVKDAATYTLEVTNQNACKANSNPVPTSIYPSPTADAGPGGFLVGTETYNLKQLNITTATGGTPPYDYVWQASPGVQYNTDAQPAFLPFSVTTTIILTVADKNGCVSRDTAQVFVGSCKISAVITGPAFVCVGNTALAKSTVSDNLGDVKYSWKSGNQEVGTSKDLSLTKPGSYFLEVVDSKGCANQSNIIQVASRETPVVSIAGNTEYCKGGGSVLNATVTGGQLPYTYQWQSGTNTVAATPNQYTATTPGSYSLTVVDNNGCFQKSQTISIVEKGSDIVSRIHSDGLLVVKEPDSVVLNAEITAGYRYQWVKDDVEISGATNSRYVARGSKASGKYVVRSIFGGCAVPSTPVTVRIEAPTSIHPTTTAMQVKLYPNPSQGKSVVEVSLPKASAAHLQLFTSTGQLYQTLESPQITENHRFEIDLTAAENGLFFWKVTAGVNHTHGKLLKHLN